MKHPQVLLASLALFAAFGCATAPTAKTDATQEIAVLPTAQDSLLIDDFEKAIAYNGEAWILGHDDNNVGTVAQPIPFVAEAGGAPSSPGHAAHIKGKLGPLQAPWPWAAFQLTIKDGAGDLSQYKALRFWAKGDGQEHRAQLNKASVKDFAHYSVGFIATPQWTQYTFPLDKFEQPTSWGDRVPRTWEDVNLIAFMPGLKNQSFEYYVDHVELIK